MHQFELPAADNANLSVQVFVGSGGRLLLKSSIRRSGRSKSLSWEVQHVSMPVPY
jgi:hypothetical protein